MAVTQRPRRFHPSPAGRDGNGCRNPPNTPTERRSLPNAVRRVFRFAFYTRMSICMSANCSVFAERQSWCPGEWLSHGNVTRLPPGLSRPPGSGHERGFDLPEHRGLLGTGPQLCPCHTVAVKMPDDVNRALALTIIRSRSLLREARVFCARVHMHTHAHACSCSELTAVSFSRKWPTEWKAPAALSRCPRSPERPAPC